MPSPTRSPDAPADRTPPADPRGENPGHVSPQIDESTVKPDQQIAQTKEQSSGQGSGQT